jgi:23S rRNA G2069 N7-methylase RlmK/C1962 C5-methylase RlmI
LIFDPPAFGRGLKGKKIWKLENDLMKLAALFPSLLSDNKPNFVLLSCHDVYWPSDKLAKLLASTMTSAGRKGSVEHDYMVLKSSSDGNSLPLGSYARWISVT